MVRKSGALEVRKDNGDIINYFILLLPAFSGLAYQKVSDFVDLFGVHLGSPMLKQDLLNFFIRDKFPDSVAGNYEESSFAVHAVIEDLWFRDHSNS